MAITAEKTHIWELDGGYETYKRLFAGTDDFNSSYHHCEATANNVLQVVFNFGLGSERLRPKTRVRYRDYALVKRVIDGVKTELLVFMFDVKYEGVLDIELDCSRARRQIDWLAVQEHFVLNFISHTQVQRFRLPNPCAPLLSRLTKRFRNMPHWDDRIAKRLHKYREHRYPTYYILDCFKD